MKNNHAHEPQNIIS